LTLRRDINPTLILVQRFLQHSGPASLAQISAEIGIADRWTREYIKILRADKKVYLAEYGKRKSNAPLMMYALGNKPDAIKPPVKRMRESRADSYAKHREKECAKKRAKRALLKGVDPKTVHYLTILNLL
jgi:hypothetical protein